MKKGEFQKLIFLLFAQISQILVVLGFLFLLYLYIFRPDILAGIFNYIKQSTGLWFLIAFYGILAFTKSKNIKKQIENQDQEEEREGEGKEEVNYIYVTPLDELKNDLLAVVVVISIIVCAEIFRGKVDYLDFWQAIIALIGVYATKKIYFKEFFSLWGKDKFK